MKVYFFNIILIFFLVIKSFENQPNIDKFTHLFDKNVNEMNKFYFILIIGAVNINAHCLERKGKMCDNSFNGAYLPSLNEVINNNCLLYKNKICELCPYGHEFIKDKKSCVKVSWSKLPTDCFSMHNNKCQACIGNYVLDKVGKCRYIAEKYIDNNCILRGENQKLDYEGKKTGFFAKIGKVFSISGPKCLVCAINYTFDINSQKCIPYNYNLGCMQLNKKHKCQICNFGYEMITLNICHKISETSNKFNNAFKNIKKNAIKNKGLDEEYIREEDSEDGEDGENDGDLEEID